MHFACTLNTSPTRRSYSSMHMRILYTSSTSWFLCFCSFSGRCVDRSVLRLHSSRYSRNVRGNDELWPVQRPDFHFVHTFEFLYESWFQRALRISGAAGRKTAIADHTSQLSAVNHWHCKYAGTYCARLFVGQALGESPCRLQCLSGCLRSW